MPDSHEALGQDVQQESADELAGRECHRALPIAMSIIPPTERDLVAVEGKQSIVGDGDAVRVTAEIAKNLLRSAKRGFRINDPFMLMELSDKSCEALRSVQMLNLASQDQTLLSEGILQSVDELAPEYLLQHTQRQQETGVTGRNPTGVVGRESSVGNDAVDVRMKQQPPTIP
jgi:hypothetical protein